jgi:hypothetical protein
MEKKKVAVSKVCHGHSRPVVDLFYSPVTPDGYFLISASKGKPIRSLFLGVRLCGCGSFGSGAVACGVDGSCMILEVVDWDVTAVSECAVLS